MNLTQKKYCIYQAGMFKYGFLTLAALIKELEDQEEYEECRIIYEVMREQGRRFNMQLPTTYDEKAIAYFKKEMRSLGYEPEVSLYNLPEYVQMLKSELENIQP
ncbi:hypothetical protein [Pontibacter beigongshangensis]|uniref:hypothetical protein n=1 Tax=Pontibacter beigongshangensis TaxID=2574733 RepID=UPI00164FF091|nr:hypothetical protein [Pontibacter beigongshangensis]